MSRMTNANSVDILDNADDFERKLSWILFQEEMAFVWYAEYKGDWLPGDPLFNRPNRLNWMHGEQYVRPMFELMDIDEFHIASDSMVWYIERCEDCAVSWDGNEPCWVCGETRARPQWATFVEDVNEELRVQRRADREAEERQLSYYSSVQQLNVTSRHPDLGTFEDYVRQDIARTWREIMHFASSPEPIAFDVEVWQNATTNTEEVFGTLRQRYLRSGQGPLVHFSLWVDFDGDTVIDPEQVSNTVEFNGIEMPSEYETARRHELRSDWVQAVIRTNTAYGHNTPVTEQRRPREI